MMWGKTEPALKPKGAPSAQEYLHVRLKSKDTVVFELDSNCSPNFRVWKHAFLEIDRAGGDTVFLALDDIEVMTNCFCAVL